MSTKYTHLTHSSESVVVRLGLAHRLSLVGYQRDRAPKPIGFWYSVDEDWERWCHDENFGAKDYAHQFSVDLGDTNILRLTTIKEIYEFGVKYRPPLLEDEPRGLHLDHMYIDWTRVAEEYDGIEIAPYQYPIRLEPEFMWYYGWDCASGCIWRGPHVKLTYIGPWSLSEKEMSDAELS